MESRSNWGDWNIYVIMRELAMDKLRVG